ncbi:hypothetical protein GGR10_001381 [Bartonella chomelii]|uniref:Uncharacterized protein n=1 Tax=Bartonella chomelii TaxID=236402 RepID=A0ABR6E4M1_9HYPH|nr:hypothetical protein [Bartonella chomelii]MBA9083509.1 hypothetical protein [Bartonella chomelii]
MMTSRNISYKKSTRIHKKQKKQPLQLEQLQRAGDTLGNQDTSFILSQSLVKVTADCRPRTTIHYAVTEQEIDALKDCSIYIQHFDTVLGILLGAVVTLVLGLIWDRTHWVEKTIVSFIISVFIGWLFYLKRKKLSRAEKIWQYIKEASEGVNEKT